MPFQIRSYTEKDLPILVRLLNKTYANAYEFTPYDEDDLRSRIQARHSQILMAVEDGETVGCVAYNDGHWGEEIEWLTAAESPNIKTIENELVKEAEKYVKRQAVFTAVDAGSPKINEWIERGYKLQGGLYQMTATLDGIKPLPKIPEGVIFRSLKPQEEKELVEAVNAGFGWQRLEIGIIQRWKSECPLFSEELVHVAEHNNKIVSVVASRFDVDYNEFFNGKRGYLGPAATLAEYRSKNLASALTRRAMNFLFEKGMNSVALYTSEQNTASITLLRKLGFEVRHHWKFMRKNLP
ncbi:MAG TPA: GNAT family N-acetyltransferase [Acidobacteriota bacterium]|nr:GNAT family N-acetyltransferase [Acidobacteriota bacterium]